MAMALGAGFYAQAQGSTAENLKAKKMKEHHAVVRQLLNRQGSSLAQKPTGTRYRVIAQAVEAPSFENPGTTEIDSTRFRYSGTRGSRFDYNSTDLLFNEYPEPIYAPAMMVPYTPDPLNMLADTITSYLDGVLTDASALTYRSDNKVSGLLSTYYNAGGTADYYDRYYADYNAQGHLTQNLFLGGTASPSALDSLQKRIVSYNAAFTQVLSDSVYTYDGTAFALEIVARYYYNASNRLDSAIVFNFTSGSAEEAEKLYLDYYSDGKLRRIIASSEADGFSMADSFAYTTGIDYVTHWDSKFTFVFEGEELTFGSRIIRYPGSSGLPDSAKVYDFDGISGTWTEYQTITYSYTSFGEPGTITLTEAGGGAEEVHRFYYEEYDNGLSISPLAENKEFRVFPNPFQNHLAIDWKGKQQSQVTLRLVNILGQEVYRSGLKLVSGSNRITLPELQPGNYILLLQDAQGKTWSEKLVKK